MVSLAVVTWQSEKYLMVYHLKFLLERALLLLGQVVVVSLCLILLAKLTLLACKFIVADVLCCVAGCSIIFRVTLTLLAEIGEITCVLENYSDTLC